MIFVKCHLLLQALAFSLVYAHLKMTSPEPYTPVEKELDNSPLAGDGSDFPCKISPGDFLAPTEEATYWTGHDNTINLLGSITHGGGSCQASLTSDREPTKSSDWKVIKSYEGGCPASVPSNLPGDATSDHSLQLHFAIPSINLVTTSARAHNFIVAGFISESWIWQLFSAPTSECQSS
jgi:hypothetical protein